MGPPTAKRHKDECPSTEAEEDQLLRRSDLDDLLSKAVQKVSQDAQSTFGEVVREYDQRVTARMVQIEQDVKDLSAKQDIVAKEQVDMWEEINRLRRALEVAEEEGPAVSQGSFDVDFDRAVDATMVRINAEAPVLMPQIEKFVEEWLPDISLSMDDVTIKGGRGPGAASRFYTLHFNGIPRTAALRANKLLSSLRRGDGTWKDSSIRTGGSTVRLFISPDKSPKMATMEIHTKMAKRILSADFPQLAFVTSLREGVVFCNQLPVLRVVPEKKKSSL